MTEHTPGPWIHIPNENFRPGAVLIWTSKGPGHGAICELSGPNHYAETMAQHEANAALIATAPDMLEVLEQLEWAGCDYLGNPICPKCEQRKTVGHYTDCALNAAIKKAKGQQ
jgi:hypothetical protein